MEFDRDLAIAVRDKVREHPELHNQTVWGMRTRLSCGTTHCLAGWICVLSGVNLKWSDSLSGRTAEFTEDGQEIPVVAAEKLGLDEEQASALFYEYENRPALVMLDALIETNGALDQTDLFNVADESRRSAHG